MMLLFRISVQLSLSMEPLLAHATTSTLEQLPRELPAYFYLITERNQLDCFGRSVYSQCAPCNKTWLKFRKVSCLF